MFDPNAIPETKETGFKLLPEGGYRVLITECNFKHKNGDVNSNWFNVRFDVLPYDGVSEYELTLRRLYTKYTWENANAMAVEIGRGTLADLMFAVAAPGFTYPAELPELMLNKELYIEVFHKARKDQPGSFEESIRGYWSLKGRQRKKNEKPLPKPPTHDAIANAPAKATRAAAPMQAQVRYGYDPGPGDMDSPF